MSHDDKVDTTVEERVRVVAWKPQDGWVGLDVRVACAVPDGGASPRWRAALHDEVRRLVDEACAEAGEGCDDEGLARAVEGRAGDGLRARGLDVRSVGAEVVGMALL